MKKTMILIMFFSVYTVYAEDTNKYLDPSLGGWFFNTYNKKDLKPKTEKRIIQQEDNYNQPNVELSEVERQKQLQIEFKKDIKTIASEQASDFDESESVEYSKEPQYHLQTK